MKIYFECLGFRTNSVFLGLDKEHPPMPYGVIIDNGNQNEIEYWIENYMPTVASKEEIIKEYLTQLKEKGIVTNNVSKEAWLEGKFGEKKDDD